MLYRTHHPSFPLFQFHPFLSATTPTSLPPLLHPLLSSKIGNEMECVKGALKTSFRGDFVDTRTFLDEFPAAVGAGANCDDFSVDELLDLSNENGFVEEEEEGEHRVEEEQGPDHEQEDGSGLSLCAKDDFGTAASTAELSVPADDVADLEWLSHFVEDSFSSFSAAFPAGMLPEKPRSQNRPPPETTCSERPCFKTPVPAKARSKRARTGGRVWSLLYPSLSESSSTTSSSSSSTSTTTSCSPPSPWLLCTGGGLIEPVYLEAKPPVKRQKRKPSIPGAGSGQPARRCSHCGVQKTPQWRAGPLGAKTLCNACGVRFKSGRLLPEYRPACSPTFSSELHSNHHRKVLEMRRKKETTVVQPEPALAVPSF